MKKDDKNSKDGLVTEKVFPSGDSLSPDVNREIARVARQEVRKLRREREDLHLDYDEAKKFYRFLAKKQQLIKNVFLNLNIPLVEHDEYYSYALEGFLHSFLILEDGGISRKNFDSYAFVTMKRHIIDEMRRRNGYRQENTSYEDVANVLSLNIESDTNIMYVELLEYLAQVLTEKEQDFLREYLRTFSLSRTMKALKISQSTAFTLQKNIRSKCEQFLIDNE